MPNSTVIAVASAKGGVGKTTTSINLGTAIAGHGLDVVVVELDLAMANVVDFLSLEFDEESDPSMHDVLAGEIPVTDALYDAPGGATVAPSGTSLDALGSVDMSNLSAAIDVLRDRFDVVVLDTGAGVNSATTTSVQVADETILVSTPRVASIRDTEKTRTIVEERGGEVSGLVLTQAGTGSSPGSERLTEFLGVDLLCTVPQDSTIHESQDAGVPVVERRPGSEAARAYADGAATLVESKFGVALPANPLPTADSESSASAPSKEALEAQGWTFPGAGADESPEETDAPAAEPAKVGGPAMEPESGLVDLAAAERELQPLTPDGGDTKLPDEAYGPASPANVNVPASEEQFLEDVRPEDEQDDVDQPDGEVAEDVDPTNDESTTEPHPFDRQIDDEEDDDSSDSELFEDDADVSDDSLAGRVSSLFNRGE